MRRLFGVVSVHAAGTSTVSGWTVAFSFPGDQRVTSARNATVSQNGNSVTAADAGYDGTIPPAATRRSASRAPGPRTTATRAPSG